MSFEVKYRRISESYVGLMHFYGKVYILKTKTGATP